MVNNIRDIDTDRAAGKRTLAVRLGLTGARWQYRLALGVAYRLLPLYALLPGRSPWVMLPLLTLPLALRLLRVVTQMTDGPALNQALAGTAQLTLLFSVLLALGWLC